MTQTTKILERAMALSPQERADLAASLIDSLRPEIDASWESEIARRVEEIEDGTVQMLSWSEVRQRLQGRH